MRPEDTIMADWIAETFNTLGYWGIALAILLENVLPPIPSEAVLPAAGIAAKKGELHVVGVIAAASAGSLVGAVLWYYVGRWVGVERLRRWADRKGKYIGFSPKDIDRADAWFDRWGGPAVFIGRMVPGVRTLISVPAGLSGMPLGRFLAYTAAGTVLWTTLLVLVGWWLGRSSKMVEQAISWAGIAVVVGLVFWIVRRIWKAKRRHSGRQDEQSESPYRIGAGRA
jgi:membrane protein DedA with SNARE-associated domain